jgi:hypothetical protein
MRRRGGDGEVMKNVCISQICGGLEIEIPEHLNNQSVNNKATINIVTRQIFDCF